MKLRIARHTSNLKPLISFYTTVLGLDVIGSFTDHAGYDGVFIGGKNSGWHLEFTTSVNDADHHADEDDLLVFYVDEKEYDIITAKAVAHNINPVTPKNPYWKENGFTIADPDGFYVVIAIG